LHFAAQRLARQVDHRPAEFVEQHPRCFVTRQPDAAKAGLTRRPYRSLSGTPPRTKPSAVFRYCEESCRPSARPDAGRRHTASAFA
jgi:hypothetical protein